MENKKLKTMQILVVDDDSTSQILMEGILSNNGYTNIQQSSTGILALKLITKNPPDLILLDIFMPGMNGWEVCEKVRNNKKTSHIPILIVTGGPTQADEALKRSFDAGATDFLTKPIRSIELLARVKAALTIKTSHDQLTLELKRRYQAEEEKRGIISELKQALSEIKSLKGILPICSHCKNIRDDKGYWKKLEGFIQEHSEAEFSHSICPNCLKKHYKDF